jgi:hypothetical protein
MGRKAWRRMTKRAAGGRWRRARGRRGNGRTPVRRPLSVPSLQRCRRAHRPYGPRRGALRGAAAAARAGARARGRHGAASNGCCQVRVARTASSAERSGPGHARRRPCVAASGPAPRPRLPAGLHPAQAPRPGSGARTAAATCLPGEARLHVSPPLSTSCLVPRVALEMSLPSSSSSSSPLSLSSGCGGSVLGAQRDARRERQLTRPTCRVCLQTC